MRTIFFLLFCMPWLTAFGQLGQNQSTMTSLVQAKLDKATGSNVVELEVFYFPEDVETEFAMSPSGLEKSSWAKTVIKAFSRTQFRSIFLESLAQSDIQKRNGGPRDLRWGCAFFDSTGNRILSIYFDQFGDGQIDGVQISSNGKLLRLLHKRFAFR